MIIIPDTHGRDFWREPVAEYLGKEHILFLGDYLDPYEYEGISTSDALTLFTGIIHLKRENPSDITLLLGNHDLHYMCGDLMGSRYDFMHAFLIKKLIADNYALFELAHVIEAGDTKVLFTHAGLRKGWVMAHKQFFEKDGPANVARTLNEMWADAAWRPYLYQILSDLSHSRRGYSAYGSPIWNDIEDMSDDPEDFPGWYQIFGHSQQESEPVIGENVACLDCRRAFRLAENGDIKELS